LEAAAHLYDGAAIGRGRELWPMRPQRVGSDIKRA
jgi:hypothetical protein